MEPLRITLTGEPRTKKNSQRIMVKPDGKRFVMPSRQYEQYEERCLWQLTGYRMEIDEPVNVRCVYYMATRRKVDLCNLIEASLDILVRGRVLMDDHAGIVASHDGSRVRYDREHPRAEITIEDLAEEEET